MYYREGMQHSVHVWATNRDRLSWSSLMQKIITFLKRTT